MIYGLWLSATGVTTNSHQVDVIANNLANVETNGFRRQLATFRERAPESRENPGAAAPGDRLFANIGGGQLLSPSTFDTKAGELEQTGNNFDVAVAGNGYFLVRDGQGNDRLTRNGNFMADRDGNLVLATNSQARVLDADKQPIKFDAETPPAKIQISEDGTMRLGDENARKNRPVQCRRREAAPARRRDAVQGTAVGRGEPRRWPDGVWLPRKVQRRPGTRADEADGSPAHARRECEPHPHAGPVARAAGERRRKDQLKKG